MQPAARCSRRRREWRSPRRSLSDVYWLELTFAGGFAERFGFERRSPHELAIAGPAV
jgi:hypothetical protein